MKKITLLSVCCLITLLCHQSGLTQPKVTINGRIEDFPLGKVILFEALTRDTLAQASIIDHHFTLMPTKGEVVGQALPAMLLCLKDDRRQSSAVPLAIENTELTLTISGTNGTIYSGTRLQEGYTKMLQDLRQTDMLLQKTTSEASRDSIQSVIASGVESFYIQTRNTSFNSFMALVLLDFIERKFIDAKNLDAVKAMCKEQAITDSLDQLICKSLLESNKGWEGQLAPDITVLNVDGDTIRLVDLIGDKPVIIDFWASWCGPCIKEMPELKSLFAEGKVEILGVSIDDQATPWQKMLAKLQLPWTNILDEGKQIAKRYKVIAVPTKFIISKEGIIVAHNPENLRVVLEAIY